MVSSFLSEDGGGKGRAEAIARLAHLYYPYELIGNRANIMDVERID